MAKIALGNGREAIQRDCLQALVVEFIVTFLFVFAGVGSAMAAGTPFFLVLNIAMIRAKSTISE